MIAIALLMHVSLVSNYILPYGGDSPVELLYFKTPPADTGTQLFLFLDEAYADTTQCYITVLPTVYSSMLTLTEHGFIKSYTHLFALVPVGLYQSWQPYINKTCFYCRFSYGSINLYRNVTQPPNDW